jgi:DNA-binding NarL/FixJ family response regulator
MDRGYALLANAAPDRDAHDRVMQRRLQAQDASIARFSVDGHVCFIVPEDAPEAAASDHIVGSVTVGQRRYSICSEQPDDADVAPSTLLTPRELQIAVLIAQGFDDTSIGRRLGISLFTVTTHLRRAYSKLGVSSRPALASRIAGTVALHRRPADPARAADRALPPT